MTGTPFGIARGVAAPSIAWSSEVLTGRKEAMLADVRGEAGVMSGPKERSLTTRGRKAVPIGIFTPGPVGILYVRYGES